ncbi:Zinc finger and BTB domain-containing protein 40, partial [Frankliniella fusca]
MDPTRDYTVKSTRNWSSFQLFSTPSSCTSPEASLRVQFNGAHRFSIKRTQLARLHCKKNPKLVHFSTFLN